MRFDAIIIGGGESGIKKGLELLSKNLHVAIVSAGRSTISIRHAAKNITNYDALMKEGIELEKSMRQSFRMQGGIFLEGHEVSEGIMTSNADGWTVEGVKSNKLQGDTLTAKDYYLATGSFFSHGLRSNYHGITEPIFNLDINAPATPAEWINDDFFAEQPFMKACVVTDETTRAIKDGKTVSNLFCIGTIADADYHNKG